MELVPKGSLVVMGHEFFSKSGGYLLPSKGRWHSRGSGLYTILLEVVPPYESFTFKVGRYCKDFARFRDLMNCGIGIIGMEPLDKSETIALARVLGGLRDFEGVKVISHWWIWWVGVESGVKEVLQERS